MLNTGKQISALDNKNKYSNIGNTNPTKKGGQAPDRNLYLLF
jgi:hypothetical protein